MADIATLGLEVRSDQVDKGTRSLEKISGAAKRAEAAVSGFSSTSSGAASAASRLSAGMNGAEAGLERVAGAARQAQQSLRLASAAANDNIRAASKFNTANIAAQFQDIAVSAQMGMGAFQIGLQQGTQLAAVISMMENPLRGLGAAFMSVISPVSLLTIGLVSLSAAGLQMVDWPKRASQALIFLADNLKAIAPYATTAAAALALIYAPSVIAGMVSLIAWMGRVSVAAIGMGASFALANPATALVAGFAAAVIAANIFRDELTKIIGFDIVASTKEGVNAIIGIFVGSYDSIVAGWSKLPDAFGDLAYQAANSFLAGIQFMVREAVTLVNGMIASMNGSIRDGFEAMGLSRGDAPQLSDLGQPRDYKFQRLDNPYSGSAKSFDDSVLKFIQHAQKTDYVGNMYSAIENGASAAADKLRELAKGLTDVDEKTKKGKKGRHGKTDAEYYQDIIDGADRRIASLLVEQQALGMTEEAANALRYEQDLLNQAQQRGIELTPQQANYFKLLASTMAGLESSIQKAQDALDFAKDISRGFIDDFVSGLRSGEDAWKSFAKAALNALNKIADKILDMAMDSLFSGGGIGSLFSGIFGGGSGFGASYFPPAPSMGGFMFSSGGYTGNGGKYDPAGIVHRGELVWSQDDIRNAGGLRAAEAMRQGNLPDRSTVQRIRTSANANTSPHRMTMNMTLKVEGTGDKELMAQMRQGTEEMMKQGFDQFSREVLPGRVNQISQDPRAVGA
ncbi:phage tail length tape measure family protein [Brucella anthropi]